MGLFDGLNALAGDGDASGMSSMLERLATNGCAEHVAAWAAGLNLPVSPEQLHDALGSEQVQQMAAAAGQPAEDFLKSLSDHLSTNGATPPANT